MTLILPFLTSYNPSGTSEATLDLLAKRFSVNESEVNAMLQSFEGFEDFCRRKAEPFGVLTKGINAKEFGFCLFAFADFGVSFVIGNLEADFQIGFLVDWLI